MDSCQSGQFPLALWQDSPDYQRRFAQEKTSLHFLQMLLYQSDNLIKFSPNLQTMIKFHQGMAKNYTSSYHHSHVEFLEKFQTDSPFQSQVFRFQLGGLRFNPDEAEIYVREERPVFSSDITLESAIKMSQQYGDTGWWNLGDIADFLRKEGALFSSAMYDLGYLKKEDSWKRRTKKEENSHYDPSFIRTKNIYRKPGVPVKRAIRIPSILDRERPIVLEEDRYLLTVGKLEMVSFYVPSKEVVGDLGSFTGEIGPPLQGKPPLPFPRYRSYLPFRGHISPEQEGFELKAEKVTRGANEFIHITTSKQQNTREYLWPIALSREQFQKFALQVRTEQDDIK